MFPETQRVWYAYLRIFVQKMQTEDELPGNVHGLFSACV
jgi:hypothetical protein